MNNCKRICAALYTLGLLGCLDRNYENPFITGNLDPEWKVDADKNGIADSVEAYAGDCHAGPSECLRLAQERSKVRAQANQTIRDSAIAATAPRDSSPAPGSVVKPRPDSNSTPITFRDTVRDTIRDTVRIPKEQPTPTPITLPVPLPIPITLPISIPAPTPEPTIKVSGIKVEDMDIAMGTSQDPNVSVLPANAGNPNYTLKSGNETVVKVSGRTLVPVNPGSTDVTATSQEGGFQASLKVLVKATGILATSIAIEPMQLVVGDSALAPKITWTPANATDSGYTLATNDASKVLVVVATGGMQKCLGITAGEAVVTLTTAGKSLTKDFKVTVKPAPVTDVAVSGISAQPMTLDMRGDPQVPQPFADPIVAVVPDNAGNKEYTLASRNPGIVTVSGKKLQALSAGTAQVTITSANGKTSVFPVTVHTHVWTITAGDMVLEEGIVQPLLVNIIPADAQVKTFTLSTDSAKSIALEGNSVVALKKGRAVVTITADDGGVTGSFTVVVTKNGKGPSN